MKQWISALVLVIAWAAGGVLAQPQSPPVAGPDPWPRTAQLDGATYTMYQPQIDQWQPPVLNAHAAVSVLAPGAQSPVFGALRFTSTAAVDRVRRTVYVSDIKVSAATFPSAPNWAASYQQAFQTLFVKGPITMSLDRVEAALAAAGADQSAKGVAVQNPVPGFVFSPAPAVLVTIDGDPAWRDIGSTGFQRVLNTRALLMKDSSGAIWFHLFDGFLRAPGLAGPWSIVAIVPPGIARAATDLAKSGTVDMMEGPPDATSGKTPTLKAPAPDVVIVTRPTELIVTDGPVDWVPLDATSLLYVKNTDASVFKDLSTQQTFVLASGRWFAAPDFNGPWQFVAAKDLPPSFAQIPDSSAKENVKASIPGTSQAKEAIIATQIPQTATVDRAKATFAPQFGASPTIQPIAGTALRYVVDSPVPLIQVPAGTWYALQKAVWFQAPTLQGPWSVAAQVPPDIYTIPPSSPLYYATYVQVYDATPTTVTVGYLPGYMGTYVAADGSVVYGTGYAYAPYIGTSVWYGPPVTYGYAAALAWTPWTGWGIGFGMGWAFGAGWGAGAWGWGPAPYWGGYWGGAAWGAHGAYGAWGPGGWAASTGNVYHQWGNTGAVTRTSGGYNAWTGNGWSNQVGHSYNSKTGQMSAGQRGTVGNVYTGNYAKDAAGRTTNTRTGASAEGAKVTVGNAYSGKSETVSAGRVSDGRGTASEVSAGNDHYADVNGNVYRNTGDGWQQHSSSGWNNVDNANQGRTLQSQQESRNVGEQRSAASSWGGGDQRYGGGFDRSASGFNGGGSAFRGGGGFAGGGMRGGGRR